jgi:hypothetical protein
MHNARRLAAAATALALMFVLLSGPALAADSGHHRSAGASSQSGSWRSRARIDARGFDPALQSRLVQGLSMAPGINAAGIGVTLTNGIIQLVGQITDSVLALVRQILSSFGIDLPITVPMVGGGSTTTSVPPTTVATPVGSGGDTSGGRSTGLGGTGGFLSGLPDLFGPIQNLITQLLQFVQGLFAF